MGPMEAAVQGLESALHCYLSDLAFMPEEQLTSSAGGVARTPVDFTFEICVLNERVTARFLGLEPRPEPEGDWWCAPAELQSKAAITEYLKTSTTALIEAVKSVPESDAERLVGTRPAYATANFASMHMMYHCAQLNFIQSLNGDDKMHWR